MYVIVKEKSEINLESMEARPLRMYAQLQEYVALTDAISICNSNFDMYHKN